MQRQNNDTRSVGGVSSPTCRTLLSLLRDCSEPMPVAELAERVAATSADSSTEADASTADSWRVRLHHHHLPKLDDVGIVDWDRERQTVTRTARAIDDGRPTVELLHAETQDVPDSVLADDCRREIVAIVKAADAPITRQHLALELAASTAVDGSHSEDIVVRLHHCHLPKLADAGLLTYDREDGIVAYQGPPDLMPATSQHASEA